MCPVKGCKHSLLSSYICSSEHKNMVFRKERFPQGILILCYQLLGNSMEEGWGKSTVSADTREDSHNIKDFILE